MGGRGCERGSGELGWGGAVGQERDVQGLGAEWVWGLWGREGQWRGSEPGKG